jgi:superfamily II DNA/RNA helicase
MGFDETTEIQEQAIPLIIAGRDVIGCAQTGTGKTAAYLIPTIDRFTGQNSNKTRALIVAPTRELAAQIDQNIEALSYFTPISSISVIGGKDSKNWDKQKFGVTNGADVVVATPGRLITLLTLNLVDFSELEVVILDEADKMLDMGFYGDILKIMSYTPDTRQTLMFSATMPRKIRELAHAILKDPAEVSLNLAKPAEGIDQTAFMVHPDQKIPLLEHLIRERDVESMIIFASSKASVDKIHRNLHKLKYKIEAIHSDKEQEERQETLRRFKNKEFLILVGTDVLARGIDIDNLSHVVNFDVPHDAEDYVHRVGRTARANSTGEAITFITPKDQHKFAQIEELIEKEVPKPAMPPEIGETPVYSPRGSRGGGGGYSRERGGGGGGRGRGGNPGSRNGGRGPRRDGPKSERRNSSGNSSQTRKPEEKREGQEGNREGSPKRRNNRNRNRNRNRNQPDGNNDSPNNSSPTPPQE